MNTPSLTKAPRAVRKQVQRTLNMIDEYLSTEGVAITDRTPELVALFIAFSVEQRFPAIFDAEEADDAESFTDLRMDIMQGIAMGAGRILAVMSTTAKRPERVIKTFTKLIETYANAEQLAVQSALLEAVKADSSDHLQTSKSDGA